MKIHSEGAALLNMLKASLSASPSAPETLPSPLNWTFLDRVSRRHRLGPLLHDGLQRSLFVGIPDWLVTNWEAQRREAVAFALYHQEALEELAAAFEGRGVPLVLLKGEALSRSLYPQVGLRPYYHDIDLLIPHDSYETAKAILMGLGFRLRRPYEEAEKRRLFGEIEFDREGMRRLTVDLHWDTLMASWEPHSLFREEETWAARDQIRLGDRALSVLGGEILLLYLCVHFAFHHVFDGLIYLCDLFLLLRRDGDRTDWDRLLAMATRSGSRHVLYYSLFFAKLLMAAPVPSRVLDGLKPSAPNRILLPGARLLFRDVPVPQVLERYIKFLLIDSNQGRLRAVRTWFRSSKAILERRPSDRDA